MAFKKAFNTSEFQRRVADIKSRMEEAGFDSPQGEALCLMSILEGESLFTGEGRRWEKDRGLVRDTILKFVESRYGKSK